MLVISTATKRAYIALKEGDIIDYREIDADCRQSENILKEIDDILDKNNLTLRDVTDFGVVVGPGSFTGVRIGTALIKGLCAGDPNHLVYPISTLDFMAKEYTSKKEVSRDFYCIINALSGRLFVAKYDKAGNKIGEERMISEQELLTMQEDKIFLKEEFPDFISVVTPSAQVLLELAQEIKNRNKGIKGQELTPVYIRKSQAEENLN